MKVIYVRNVHEALPVALDYLYTHGVRRESRNGPVLQAPEPVSTVYHQPTERVLFWPDRDANPFLHLYESLWMLAGRNDVAPLKRYSKQFEQYTDDGATLHGAYGHRWRRQFGFDQLSVIAERLRKNPEDRRCVLQMWDAKLDLQPTDAGKDLPCNDTATFQIGPSGALDMVVFCRSNDIVWGAYGANAVHFSFLLEYMAVQVGVPVGTYTQISINWHGYLKTLEKVEQLKYIGRGSVEIENQYEAGRRVRPTLIPTNMNLDALDSVIQCLLEGADEFKYLALPYNWGWSSSFARVLRAHNIFKSAGPQEAIDMLMEFDAIYDWERAAVEWLQRRVEKPKTEAILGVSHPL